jgi:phosphoheptose isomerase
MRYFEEIISILKELKNEDIQIIAERFNQCSQNGGTVYIAGNGGSAAIADHFACDYNKAAHNEKPEQNFRAVTLQHSMSLSSALNNDFESKEVFAWQVKHFCRESDVFLGISSSGKSMNILNAIHAANANGIFSISLTGMNGGPIKTASKLNLNIESYNYGVIEDCHMSILHSICQNRVMEI